MRRRRIADRLAGLAPLDFSGCCAEAALAGSDDEPLGARIEMLRSDPVLRTSGGRRGGPAVLNVPVSRAAQPRSRHRRRAADARPNRGRALSPPDATVIPEDAYYYGRKRMVELPAYRTILGGGVGRGWA